MPPCSGRLIGGTQSRQASLTALYRDAALLRPPYRDAALLRPPHMGDPVAPGDFDRLISGHRLTQPPYWGTPTVHGDAALLKLPYWGTPTTVHIPYNTRPGINFRVDFLENQGGTHNQKLAALARPSLEFSLDGCRSASVHSPLPRKSAVEFVRGRRLTSHATYTVHGAHNG